MTRLFRQRGWILLRLNLEDGLCLQDGALGLMEGSFAAIDGRLHRNRTRRFFCPH